MDCGASGHLTHFQLSTSGGLPSFQPNNHNSEQFLLMGDLRWTEKGVYTHLVSNTKNATFLHSIDSARAVISLTFNFPLAVVCPYFHRPTATPNGSFLWVTCDGQRNGCTYILLAIPRMQRLCIQSIVLGLSSHSHSTFHKRWSALIPTQRPQLQTNLSYG